MKSVFLTSLAPPDFQFISEPDCVWGNGYLKKLFAETMSSLSDSGASSLIFEMVCKDRTSCDGCVHRELAVSYPRSGLFLLGCFVQGEYLPSYNIRSCGNHELF